MWCLIKNFLFLNSLRSSSSTEIGLSDRLVLGQCYCVVLVIHVVTESSF
jgi:hypothetical protein